MNDSSAQTGKKKPGVLVWLGLGCGALVLVVILGGVAVGVLFWPKIKQYGEDYKKDPTRATAYALVGMSAGVNVHKNWSGGSTSISLTQFEMVKEDEANKRYTVRNKSTGQLSTIYWDAKRQKPMTVQGDFSAIPQDAGQPSASGEK